MFLRKLIQKNALAIFALIAFVFANQAEAALVIADKPTADMTCADRVCTATAENAVLSVNMLLKHIAHANLTIVSGSIAGDIEIDGAVSWANAHKLTLDSFHSVVINKSVAVTGPGELVIKTDDGGTGGNHSFGPKGNVTFWDLSSSLVINGGAYTLVNNIAALASDIASNPVGKYALAASYEASVDGTYAASPIPTMFNGVLEGLGNTISNFSIHNTSPGADVSLLETLGQRGRIRNINLIKADVVGSGSSAVAPLVSLNYGIITNSFASGTVVGGGGKPGTRKGVQISQIAGLVASNSGGTIISSHSAGTIISKGDDNEVGGLVADAGDMGSPWAPFVSKIINSHSNSRIIARGAAFAGGLVGLNGGFITGSWAAGSVTIGNESIEYPQASAGGLVGYALSFGGPAKISNCYATGAVIGGQNTNVGGLIGVTFGNNDYPSVLVEKSYSTGAVSAASGSSVGGFVGAALGNDVSYPAAGFGLDYWDINTSGVSDLSMGVGDEPSSVQGLTTSQLQSGLPAGFSPTVWAQTPSINGGLPYLLNNPPPG